MLLLDHISTIPIITTLRRLTAVMLVVLTASGIVWAQPTTPPASGGTTPPKPAVASKPAASKPATPKPADTAKPEGPASTKDEYEKRYQERITKDRLYGVYIPKNLEDAMAQLDKQIAPDTRALIKVIPEDSVCLALHRRLGIWMINNWGFYEGSRLSHYLRSAGVTYPDDMADFLILAYHRHLNQKPIEIKELAKYFRETRKKEYLEDVKKGEIISEETRQRPKPATTTAPPPTTPPAPAPAPTKPPAGTQPKGKTAPRQ
jgi:hypothetical protein